jgi:Mitochondrial ribosome subunit S26
MRSVRAWFREEFENKKLMVAQSLTPADEEAEFQRCSSINEQWNLEISKKRDARVAAENAERRAHIEKTLIYKAEKEKQIAEEVDDIVRKEKAAAKTFITRDNVDKAIEEALANLTEYNFSIDLQGTIYKGSDQPGKSTKVEP